MKLHQERLHQARPRSSSLQHLSRLNISTKKRGPQGFVSSSHENSFLRTGNNVSGGVPSRRQLPVTEPVPFQVFLNYDRLLQCSMLSKIESVISLTCPQLEGSKRFGRRAAAKQEGVLRWVDKFIFVENAN